MVSEPACNFLRGEVSKVAPLRAIPLPERAPSGEVFLLDLLRPLEERLINRGMLPYSNSLNFHPLWFIAETERNIFLWRRGESLADADLYEFWVEPEFLIRKRIGQIARGDALQRLKDSLLAGFAGGEANIGHQSPDKTNPEIDYLTALGARLKGIGSHLEGLSHFSCSLRKVLGNQERNKVTLPAA